MSELMGPGRAKRVQALVDELYRVDRTDGVSSASAWLMGWIDASVRPDNGRSDTCARRDVQEAVQAYIRWRDERMAARGLARDEVVTGPPAMTASAGLSDNARALLDGTHPAQVEVRRLLAGDVPGEVYDRDDEPDPIDLSTVDGYTCGGRR